MKGTEGYKIRTVTCVACGKTVAGHIPPRQRYCSLKCYRASPKPQRKTGEVRACAVCGTEVYIPNHRLAQSAHFCSKAHADEWAGRNKTEHVCKMCGKTFRWSPSRSKSGQYNITYCSLACRDADPQRREMLIGMNATQQRLRPNHVERAGYAILDSLGVPYERQYLIGGKFCVDAFVPSRGLVVQFDGDYWHGNPTHFPTPDTRQQRRMRLDRSQDAYMTACGYRVLRLWASEIQKQPEDARERLCAALVQS